MSERYPGYELGNRNNFLFSEIKTIFVYKR